MTRGRRDPTRYHRSRLIIERVLERATRKGTWDAQKCAEVILASLTPSRITHGVVGPCWYCGDDYASTVDHLTPLSEGGADEPANVVSCCLRCNGLKGTMTERQFRASHPYGSDEARNIAHWMARREAWSVEDAELWMAHQRAEAKA
jgi:5-methylcytosine-specific restriction endonuclease McrA